MTKRLVLLAVPPIALGLLAAAQPSGSMASANAAAPPKAKRPAAAAPVKKAAVKTAAKNAPPAAPLAANVAPAPVAVFLKANCVSCHDKDSKAGGLDITALKFDLGNPQTFAEWVKVHDRVRDGEMPPKGMPQPSGTAQGVFLRTLTAPMVAADTARARREGRAVWRRMNRYEYENTVRDLLDAPYLQLRDMLPEDGEAFRFNKVGTALDVSHVQMSRYLAAADFALREVATQAALAPETVTKRYYAREMRSFIGPSKFSPFNGASERATFPIVGATADLAALEGTAPMTVGASDPVRRDQEAFGVVASAYEPLEPKFDKFRAPVDGRYHLRLCANSFWAGPESAKGWWRPNRKDVSAGRTHEPVTLYSEIAPRLLRKLGTVDVGPDPTVAEVDVYLLKGETVRPDAVRLFRSRPPAYRNPLATPEGQPGVAFHYLEVQGPLYDQWPGKGFCLLFGDLPIETDAKGARHVVSHNPDADTLRLMRGFVASAYRAPVSDDEIAPFLALAKSARDSGASFTDSLIAAYSAVLCSPEFITLREKPGPLDDSALAARLSYLLWNSEPDPALRSLAATGTLHQTAVLRAQTERMLDDPRSERFVDAFLDYWLDLRKLNNNSPDADLYPDYYLDDFLRESAEDETHAFFESLIKGDLPASNVVSSNFVMVNDRLASLYGLPGVQGSQIRRVDLPADSPRGGFLTQAAILKVTANGTTTSPVVRGAWITERILGQPVPPPPPSVPAVEPDTRGATTIREQLAKHRTQPTCKACHAKIDPPGFALESFDVFGGWRDHYRALGDGGPKVEGRGKNGQAFAFHVGPPVDATGTLPDGRSFQDVRDLKRLLCQDERQLARNLVRQFVTYGTGAPVRFGDRPAIEAILDRAAPGHYGVKTLLTAVVESELFRDK